MTVENTMPLADRKKILANILTTIRAAGYHYDLSKGGARANPLFPPPAGSKLNCRSLAWVFMKYANKAGVDGLQPIFFKWAEGGFLVMEAGTYKALREQPQYRGQAFSGWQFDNHYRVKDPQSGVVYDPTFCTASNVGRGNPPGVQATSETTDPKTFSMTTVYGGRYEVATKGVQVSCRELNHNLVLPAYIVDDAKFKPTTLNL